MRSPALLLPQTRQTIFANWGGEFVDDAIRAPATRPDFANISAKIERQMQTRGWTPDLATLSAERGEPQVSILSPTGFGFESLDAHPREARELHHARVRA